MQFNGERTDEIYASTLDTIRPVLLKLEKEQGIHVYPVTRSLSNPTFKVYDIYAAHHLIGSIELREMRQNRVLISFCPKRFDARQVELGTVPQEILNTFEQFASTFRGRLRDLGFESLPLTSQEKRV
ncbi:MAG TPA: hypothetical protein VMT46_14590 [Anaerolineaceae bacterium]|nr:hypothetical protein [Anaerolineaceae bacterium]